MSKSTILKNVYYLRIAGLVVKIDFLPHQNTCGINYDIYPLRLKISKYFAGFILSKRIQNPDICVKLFNHLPKIFTKGKENSKSYFMCNYIEHGNEIHTFQHLSFFQFIYLLRSTLQSKLLQKDGFFFHASACIINQKAILFAGNSGAGKSTISEFLKSNFHILADDCVIIRRLNNIFYCFQAPILEKNYEIQKNWRGTKIGAVFSLKKSNRCRLQDIENLSKRQEIILNQLMTNKKDLQKQIDILRFFASSNIKYSNLYFTKNKKAVINFFQNLILKY